MGEEQQPTPVLEYESVRKPPQRRRRRKRGRWRVVWEAFKRAAGWFANRSPCLIALAMLLPWMALDDFGWFDKLPVPWNWRYMLVSCGYLAILFVPGAVNRRNWRHLLIMLAVSAGCYALENALPWFKSAPYALAMLPSAAFVLVGLCEWAMARPLSRSRLLWMLVLALGAACTFRLIERMLYFNGGAIRIPMAGGGPSHATWRALAFYPLQSLLVWLVMVPLALRLGLGSTRKQKVLAGGSVVLAAAVYAIFLQVLIYPIARQSLLGSGPFSKCMSVVILGIRARPDDLATIRQAMEQADLSKEPEPWEDLPRTAMAVLTEHDRAGTARWLSQWLRKAPSPDLAAQAAPLLASEHRYEAAPELLRAALIWNGQASADALIDMGAAQAIRAAILAQIRSDLVWPGRVLPVNAQNRRRLARLLGKDAGPNPYDWLVAYEQARDTLSTDLPEPTAGELRRVEAAMDSYWDARKRLKAKPSAEVAGPDWQVPGTDGLEREVAAYVKRVDAAIGKK